jgi:hypothetical protein
MLKPSYDNGKRKIRKQIKRNPIFFDETASRGVLLD